MLRPHGTRQLLSRVLNKLRSDGFVDYTVLPDASRSRTNAWYLTQQVARLTRHLPVLRAMCRPRGSEPAGDVTTHDSREAAKYHRHVRGKPRPRADDQ